MSEEPFDRIDKILTAVDHRFTRIDARLEDLNRNMHAFYEDLKSDIKALRSDGPTRAEVNANTPQPTPQQPAPQATRPAPPRPPSPFPPNREIREGDVPVGRTSGAESRVGSDRSGR